METKSPSALVETVVEEVFRLQGKGLIEIKEMTGGSFFLPPSLPAPEGRSIWITPDGLRAVHLLGNWWKTSSDVGRRTTTGEAHKAAARAIGKVLATFSRETLTEALAPRELRKRIEDEIAPLVDDTEHFFRIHLFRHFKTDTLLIGPVRLETGDAWRARIAAQGSGDQLDPSHWDGLASSPWIGGVTVRGRTLERSREQAAACLRLALDTITLPMSVSQSREVRGPSDTFEPGRTQTATRFSNGFLAWGGSSDVFGLRSSAGDIEEFIARQSGLFGSVGQILTILTDDGSVEKPALKRHWIEALYWFGESRRSADDFVALVKIGIALDILSGGGEDRGIIDLCKRIWGREEGQPVTSDGRSIKKLVRQIYKDGRSRISHGTRFGLLEDLPVLRADADRFCAIILIAYVEMLDRYSGPDNPKAFRSS